MTGLAVIQQQCHGGAKGRLITCKRTEGNNLIFFSLSSWHHDPSQGTWSSNLSLTICHLQNEQENGCDTTDILILLNLGILT